MTDFMLSDCFGYSIFWVDDESGGNKPDGESTAGDDQRVGHRQHGSALLRLRRWLSLSSHQLARFCLPHCHEGIFMYLHDYVVKKYLHQ